VTEPAIRLAHVVPSLESRHGGPSRSVRALASAQAETGASIDVLATREWAEPEVPTPTRARILEFPRQVPRFLCRSDGLAAHLRRTEYDCIHSHALWLKPFAYAAAASRRNGIPLVVSPRGMLTPWALAHHRWKKWLAARLVHPGAFARAAGWHATSAAEADDIRRQGFAQPVCVAPNGVDIPSTASLAAARATWLQLCPPAGQQRIALFYSRFHRKKRLRELLQLWLSKPRDDWYLLIVGLPEEYSLAEVQNWIAESGGTGRAGAFDGTGRPPPYAVSSLFLFPSHSENFGLVVAEALAAGVPVLATDATPWRTLDATGSGWCVSWDRYDAALARALTTPSESLGAMGALGRTLAATDYSWDRSSRVLLDFYRQLRRG
jgi:glycosyltransferase involved in cell wall biosynthesis